MYGLVMTFVSSPHPGHICASHTGMTSYGADTSVCIYLLIYISILMFCKYSWLLGLWPAKFEGFRNVMAEFIYLFFPYEDITGAN